MKIQAITPGLVNQRKSSGQKIKETGLKENSAGFNYGLTITFKGGNPDHLILTAAETQGMQVKGGVSTVLNEYFGMPGKQMAAVFPFNNASLIHDFTGVEIEKDETGKQKISIHKFPDDHPDPNLRGQFFWTGVDLDSTPLKEVMSDPGKYIIVTRVAEKPAPWDSKEKITLLKVRDRGRVNGKPDKLNGFNHDIFLVYNDALGAMREPYDTGAGGYSSKTLEQLRTASTMSTEFRASEYAQYARMYAEFQDDVIRHTRTNDGSVFDPKTVNCSDGQTSLIPYFLKQAKKTTVEPFFTLHNGNPGYTGETGGRQMFQDLLLYMPESQRTQTIDNLVNFPEYQKAMISGKEDEFFRRYLPMLVDDNKCFNPVLAALQLAIPTDEALKNDKFAKGFVKGVNTVSNGYADDLAYNENIGSGIQSIWRSLYKRGLALGIMNPISDPKVSGFEDITGQNAEGKTVTVLERGYLPGYQKPYTIKYPDGTEEVIQPFERFKEAFFKDEAGNVRVNADTLRHVDQTRLDNQINFFKRLSGRYDADDFQGFVEVQQNGKPKIVNGEQQLIRGSKLRNLLINGLEGKNVELIGHISPEVLAQFEAAKAGTGKAPTVFVSWGRLDDQKAMDQVMRAFDKFRRENPDAVLVLGGPAAYEKNGELQPCSKKIIEMAQELAKKHEGHFVFMNGFAPGKVLSGVADAAIFPSRFAPCELTDLENKKYLSRVIVTNTQGLADKNFDPEIEADKEFMDGYKTKNGFFDITRTDIEADDTVKLMFRDGIPGENLSGYSKLYNRARTIFLNRMANSGKTYEHALIENYTAVLSGILDTSALQSAKTTLESLKLQDADKTKLQAILTPLQTELTATEAALKTTTDDAQLKQLAQKLKELQSKISPLQQFTTGSKLTDKDAKALIAMLQSSTLDDADKLKFTNLLNGTTKAAVEDSLLRLIFNKDKLKDKHIQLASSLDETQFGIMKAYLANPKNPTRTRVEFEIVNKKAIDESQIRAAKRIFNLDPIHNLILQDGKLKTQYNNLFNRCRNEIIENQIVHCMGRVVDETEANRIKMLGNHYRLDTTWGGNERLTKLKREDKPASTLYLYEEILKSTPAEGEAVRTDNNFLTKLLNAIIPQRNNQNNNAANAFNDVAETAVDTAKKSGMSKGLKIALGAGAAIVALGGAYYAMNKSGSKSNAHGDTFKPSNAAAKQPAKPAQPALSNPYLATK